MLVASPSTGVNTATGEGLAEALAGARVVVDVANDPASGDKAALEFFFEKSGRNLRSLTPGDRPCLGLTRFADWLALPLLVHS